jgi:pyruvate dehydrogenase phosphatase
MLRKSWLRVVAAVGVGAPAYLYYRSWRDQKQQNFTLFVREKGKDGMIERVAKSFPLLSLKDVEERIREHGSFETRTRPNGLTWNHTTALLASNDPIEDANSNQIIQRDDFDPSAPGDYLFFTVMDGHSGYHTSQLLSRTLINAVALELSQLIKKPDAPGRREWLKSFIWSPSSPPLVIPSPQRVALAIQDAFTKFDAELINAPLRVLANNIDEESRKNKKIPDLSKHPLALTTMMPAVSGKFILYQVICL